MQLYTNIHHDIVSVKPLSLADIDFFLSFVEYSQMYVYYISLL